MNVLYKVLIALLLSLAVFAGAVVLYGRYHSSILERKDVQFFKVEKVSSSKPIHLRISGLAFMSAMSVHSITVETTGSKATVLVHVGLARRGTSGTFAYELTVPDSVREVTFGTDPAPIWTRNEP